jgi:hypothetical protein
VDGAGTGAVAVTPKIDILDEIDKSVSSRRHPRPRNSGYLAPALQDLFLHSAAQADILRRPPAACPAQFQLPWVVRLLRTAELSIFHRPSWATS